MAKILMWLGYAIGIFGLIVNLALGWIISFLPDKYADWLLIVPEAIGTACMRIAYSLGATFNDN